MDLACPHCRILQQRVDDLTRQVEDLNRRLEEKSRASKRQAAPFSKGPPKPQPKKPGRKPGLAYGRPAHRPPPKHIDEVLEAPLPDACPHCGGDLDETAVTPQYQVEIVRKTVNRQINVHLGCCRRCQRRVQGRHPLQTSDALGAAASQLGPDAQAAMVELNKQAGLSHGKVVSCLKNLFGLDVSRSASVHTILRAGQRCEPIYQKIRDHVGQAAVVGADETGWHVGGGQAWLHTLTSELATLYAIDRSRGSKVAEDVLGLDFQGVLTHDGWSPYDHFVKAQHQQCLWHLLNRCDELLAQAKGGAVCFPRKIRQLLDQGLALRDRHAAGAISTHGLRVARGRLQYALEDLIFPNKTNAANERLAAHLWKHHDELFTFLDIAGVDATNWRAEQAIRFGVILRKIWGGNRTWVGAQAQAVLMSVIRTCWQQGRNAMDFLSRILRGQRQRLQLAALPP